MTAQRIVMQSPARPSILSEGLRPSDSPTRSCAPLRRRASAYAKAPARPRRSAHGAKAGRSRGSLAMLARTWTSFAYFQPVDLRVNRAGIAGLLSGAGSDSPDAAAISRSSSSSFGRPAN